MTKNTHILEYEAEEYHCAMMVLDDLGVPKRGWDEAFQGITDYSLVGRIYWLKNNK